MAGVDVSGDRGGAPPRRVVLIWPGRYRALDPDLPISLLYLVGPLREAGFEPHVLDMQVTDYRSFDFSRCLLFGISSMSSCQLAHGVEVATHLRRLYPSVPIVWGGDHVATEDVSTVESGLCDYAVRGEGQVPLVALAKGLSSGATDLAATPGVTTRVDGVVVRQPIGPQVDFTRLNHLPYDCLDLSAYRGLADRLPYLSSKGCPFTCAFCTWQGNRKLRAKPAEVVVEELATIAQRYGVRTVAFSDATFFAQIGRARRIAELLIERDLGLDFYATCRVDLFERIDDDALEILKRARFRELAFGGESGSDEQLRLMSKRTTAAQILASATRCQSIGIVPIYSFLLGLPGELDEHVPRTIDLIDRLHEVAPSARCNIMAIFDPFPGAEYTNKLLAETGYRLPTTLREWATGRWLTQEGKIWIPRRRYRQYEVLQALVRFFYVWRLFSEWDWETMRARHNGSAVLAAASWLAHAALWPVARLRWRTRFYHFGYEMLAWRNIGVLLRGHA